MPTRLPGAPRITVAHQRERAGRRVRRRVLAALVLADAEERVRLLLVAQPHQAGDREAEAQRQAALDAKARAEEQARAEAEAQKRAKAEAKAEAIRQAKAAVEKARAEAEEKRRADAQAKAEAEAQKQAAAKASTTSMRTLSRERSTRRSICRPNPAPLS